MLDHTSIPVADLARATRFYDPVLQALGLARTKEVPGAVGYGTSASAAPCFWLLSGAVDVARPGVGLHIAFQAPSRASVDEFHARALTAGAKSAGAPGVRPEYTQPFYGAFVRDLDGFKVEAVCRLRQPRIVYLHGDGVLYWSWGWVARLQGELRRAGFPTYFELFPDSIEARSQYWLPFLREHVRVTQDDVLLGWSSGAAAAMRYAQDHPVRGLVLVAPYYTDLGSEAVRRSGWVSDPWDWDRVRANASDIAMFCSDKDPYVSQAELSELATQLDAEVHRVLGAGHFSEQDTFPELTQYLLHTYR